MAALFVRSLLQAMRLGGGAAGALSPCCLFYHLGREHTSLPISTGALSTLTYLGVAARTDDACGRHPCNPSDRAQNIKVFTDHLSLLHRHGDQISEYDRHGGEGHPEIYYSVK